MRKIAILTILAIFLMFPLVTRAEPFLVCDPQAGVLRYDVVIEQNGIPVMGGIVPAEADTTCKFDLVTIQNGTYIAMLRAGNLWGWSDWSQPFGFMVGRCSQPTGVLIIP